MDILSEVLRVVRLSGAIHFLAELRHPWSFSSSPHEILAARLKLPHGSVTPFHIFIEGMCHVSSGDHPPVRAERGDIIIFPRGDVHILASEIGLPPVPIRAIYSKPSNERITVVKYGGTGDPARFICGFLHLDQQFDPLLSSLPDVMCVRPRDSGLELETLGASGARCMRIEHQREAHWWRASLDYLVNETTAPEAGHNAMLARLTEAMFVQVLRWQLRYASENYGGWLAGLHDPQIGRVLALIHSLPERHWTVDGLARAAAISRPALARRFVELVGHSPIQYLAGWRMQLARHLLSDSTMSIGQVGGRIGYDSEAAFSRAFRRLVGSPPAVWRQANRGGTEKQIRPEEGLDGSTPATARMTALEKD